MSGERQRNARRNLLYYLFAAFIIAIFLWWWMLLFQKNENVYEEKRVLYDLIIDIDDSETTMQLYEQEVTRLDVQYKRQKWMITGEGATFLLLLIFGIVRLNQYLRKEIELARQQSNFLLSITHELKSPLASALLTNQTLIKRPGLPGEKRTALLQNSTEELQRLEELVGKLLFAARIDGEEIRPDREVVDLSELYGNLFANYAQRFGDRFLIGMHQEEALFTEGDVVLLKSIFTNLMDNAVKYCPEGGAIDVDLHLRQGFVRLSVANDGPVINDRDKTRIFEKFYRLGEEETRSSIGTGLGLYIVRRIVRSHRGRLRVLDKTGGGVIFEVDLPSLLAPEALTDPPEY